MTWHRPPCPRAFALSIPLTQITYLPFTHPAQQHSLQNAVQMPHIAKISQSLPLNQVDAPHLIIHSFGRGLGACGDSEKFLKPSHTLYTEDHPYPPPQVLFTLVCKPWGGLGLCLSPCDTSKGNGVQRVSSGSIGLHPTLCYFLAVQPCASGPPL